MQICRCKDKAAASSALHWLVASWALLASSYHGSASLRRASLQVQHRHAMTVAYRTTVVLALVAAAAT